MKPTIADAPGEKAARATRGTVSTNAAGSKGMVWRDPVTESVGQIRDMTVIGATLTDNEDGTGVLTFSGVSGVGTPPWVNAKDYDAVGDGTTDDTAAINDAIAAVNSNGCGVLYFPCGTYLVSSSLTTITANCLILGDGSHDDYTSGMSIIECTSATATVFTATAAYVRVDKLAIKNTNTTQTAGAAIAYTRSASIDAFGRLMLDDVYISNFYDGIDMQGGTGWSWRDVVVFDSFRYGMRVRNLDDPDAGNWLIDHASILNNGLHNTTAGIRLESSGAGRIQNLEVLGAIGYNQRGIDIVGDGSTSVLHVVGGSIESYGADGIRSAGSWNYQTFTNIEFGQYGNGTGHAFNLSGNSDVIIDNINLKANTGTPTAITHSTMTRLAIGQLTNDGFTTLVSAAPDQDSTGGVGARVFITGTPTSGQVPVASSGTAAAWGTLSTAPSGAAGGDLSGTYPNPSVSDDSHNHTAATLPDFSSDTDGLIPVTTSDSVTVDTGSPPGVTLTSLWGIDSGGLPYYDTAGAADGEEAGLFWDPAISEYVLISYDF